MEQLSMLMTVVPDAAIEVEQQIGGSQERRWAVY
jgi:hypothetical protein